MSKDLNLIQMFMGQSNPLASSAKGSDAKNGRADLTSIAPASGSDSESGKSKAKASSSSSFHAKVKESHANLAAKTAKLKAESKGIDAVSTKPTGKTKDPIATVKQERIDRHAKADRNHAQSRIQREKIANSKQDLRPDADQDLENTDQNLPVVAKISDHQSQDGSEDAPVMSDEAETALRDRLEKMGIVPTEEQLGNPAFLKEMLQMLQAMAPAPAPAPVIEVDAIASPEAEVPLPIVKEDTALTSVQGPAPKELADLIKDRLAEIAQNSKLTTDTQPSPTTTENVRAGAIQNPNATQDPNTWRGMRLGHSNDSSPIDPMPTADLDRMRVLQAAALQAGNNNDNQLADIDIDAAIDETNDIQDIGAVRISSLEKSGLENDAAEEEAFGQNQDQTQGAEASSRLEGPRISRDGSVGPQFHQTLDQIRASETKAGAGAERTWVPHQTAFDQGLLQQISKKLSAITHLSGGEISIQLEPENLGKIRVGLGMKDGVMTARIGVENENVRQIVEANIANLRDTLENQGIKLQGLEVSVDQRHSSLFNPDGSNSEAFFHRRGQGNSEAGSNGLDAPNLETAPESDTGRRWGYNTMEFIG